MLWATVTHLLEIVFERIQLYVQDLFVGKTSKEKRQEWELLTMYQFCIAAQCSLFIGKNP